MSFAVAYLNSFGLAALLAVAFGLSLRMRLNLHAMNIAVGALFGAAAALAMQNPIPIATGVFVDPRNLFVGLSAAFLGPLGAAASLAIAAPSRIALGGAGVGAGLLAMSIAACAGLLWGYATRERDCAHPRCLLLLGAGVSSSLVATMLLPLETMLSLLLNAGPYIVAFNLIGAVLFGGLMMRERVIAHRFGQLKLQAATDPLTGLLNRRGFERELEPVIVGGESAAVLIFDLDHFKSINDVYGHSAGDEVLVAVASLLKRSLRQQDIVARFGGEEFVVVLPRTDELASQRIAERLQIAISEISVPKSTPLKQISTSVGGFWAETTFDAVTSLRHADRALYRAKKQGRNRTEFSAKVMAA
ncbi:GGDEF domain-containing protein [Devosia pacifica]|uniref:diguanylate cyclase n=1 Tax=Devosia pacifica TaxID=1335967 RepID=A0A918VVT8_9HYPH|nr:diguanylate cyclase [Devosia pacifica]GHA27689.1 GGDEF domain-containing protein [Devosia pacifica]